MSGNFKGGKLTLVTEARRELAGADDEKAAEAGKKVQAATMLRFAGSMAVVQRHIIIQCKFDNFQTARWLRDTIVNVFGHEAELAKISDKGSNSLKEHYILRILKSGGALALESGLIDSDKRPVPGLPNCINPADAEQAKAAVRGAFLAAGSLSEPGKASRLDILCPSHEAAKMLAALSKRLNITAKIRLEDGRECFVLTDPDSIERMLILLGAENTAREWSGTRITDPTQRSKVSRMMNFDDANMRRSAKAAIEAGEKVLHAFEILGEDIPANLRAAGELRLAHREASLEELGRMANPPLSKDAIAGRIRRLFQLAIKAEKKRAFEESEKEALSK